jgi:hypothetical protein
VRTAMSMAVKLRGQQKGLCCPCLLSVVQGHDDDDRVGTLAATCNRQE